LTDFTCRRGLCLSQPVRPVPMESVFYKKF
jgi:hypothetical protein